MKHRQLTYWTDLLIDLSKSLGWDGYEPVFEICGQKKMIEACAYLGYPMYRSWSFGKQAEVTKKLYDHDYFFLPYELVVNSDPCRAYVLDTNPLHYNIEVVAHTLWHNHFFKNNGVFRNSKPREIFALVEYARSFINKCIANPNIGLEKVEPLIDALHAVRFTHGIIDFILANENDLSKWEKEIARLVKEITNHIRPSLKIHIMNEGWATYWHYRLIRLLAEKIQTELSFNKYWEIIRLHHSVIRQPDDLKKVNPYRVGFFLWQKIAARYGEKKIFDIARHKTDLEFLLEYLDNERDFIYEHFVKPALIEPAIGQSGLSAPEVLERMGKSSGDEPDFIKAALTERCRKFIVAARGENAIPFFNLSTERDSWGRLHLHLRHRYDGRRLEESYLNSTLILIRRYLWRRGPVHLHTRLKIKNPNSPNGFEERPVEYIAKGGNVNDKEIQK